MQRHRGYRYYTWELKAGQLEISKHPVNLPREKKYEGKYLIQTDQSDITPQEAVLHYKELNEVERGFRSLKDPLRMRPVWHRVDRRVKAHIFVAALSFLIERMLDRALRDAGVSLSATSTWEALKTIRHVQFRVDGKLRCGVTHRLFSRSPSPRGAKNHRHPSAAPSGRRRIYNVVTNPKSGPCAATTYDETCQTWARIHDATSRTAKQGQQSVNILAY